MQKISIEALARQQLKLKAEDSAVPFIVVNTDR